MSIRVTAAAGFVAQGGIAVTTAARVLGVSGQAVDDRMTPAMQPAPVPALRLLAPALPDHWQTMDLGPAHWDVATAIHVLARRHPAAGYRTIEVPQESWTHQSGQSSCWSGRMLSCLVVEGSSRPSTRSRPRIE